MFEKNKYYIKILTLDRGSLGSWVDEDRSKLRVVVWTAGHMIIDKLNAYCTLYIIVYNQIICFELCIRYIWLSVVNLSALWNVLLFSFTYINVPLKTLEEVKLF